MRCIAILAGTCSCAVAEVTRVLVDRSRADGERSAVAVLHVCEMHFGSDQQAGCVGDYVPLAAYDFLSGIETARPASLSGPDRLGIGDLV